MDPLVLSDLCSSCHTQQPKYKCPRCKAQTCSLACYKRHQQRASCTGQRDPTAFLRKSHWSTPSGLDHDYNYLRGVERSIDAAGTDLRARGIGVPAATGDPAPSKTVSRAWLPDGPLAKYLRANRIAVEHAPVGMTRQKTNRTRATKSGNVVWTVEWVHDPEGETKQRQNDCLSSNSVAELYRMLQVQRRNVERRRREAEGVEDGAPQQSKRSKVEVLGRRKPLQYLIATLPPDGGKGKTKVDYGVAALGRAKQGTDDLAGHLDGLPPPPRGPDFYDPNTPLPTPNSVKQEELKTEEQEKKQPPPPSTLASDATSPAQHQSQYFYLRTPAPGSHKRIVLSPLNPAHTLTETLRDRSVQEYPTIYVLPYAPESLPRRFVLQEDDDVPLASNVKAEPNGGVRRTSVPGRRGDDEVVVKEEWRSQPSAKAQPPGRAAPLDAGAILDMLRRDVGS